MGREQCRSFIVSHTFDRNREALATSKPTVQRRVRQSARPLHPTGPERRVIVDASNAKTLADQIAAFEGALTARQLSELLSISAVTSSKWPSEVRSRVFALADACDSARARSRVGCGSVAASTAGPVRSLTSMIDLGAGVTGCEARKDWRLSSEAEFPLGHNPLSPGQNIVDRYFGLDIHWIAHQQVRAVLPFAHRVHSGYHELNRPIENFQIGNVAILVDDRVQPDSALDAGISGIHWINRWDFLDQQSCRNPLSNLHSLGRSPSFRRFVRFRRH